MTQPAPYAVVLAAGAGSRFGGAKLLAPYRGKPLVTHAALAVAEAIAAGALAGGVAVLPPGDTRLPWLLDSAGLSLIENRDAASGIASSLRAGLRALTAPDLTPPAGAAVVVLADQPLQRAETIARLVEAWRRHGGSIRPRYRLQPDEPGHPVLLDRGAWALAESLSGDEGFGSIFRQRPDAVTIVDLPGANPDVDRPEDLLHLEESDG
jgi:CTP:molybdopterin cytidylyltransferase MocA